MTGRVPERQWGAQDIKSLLRDHDSLIAEQGPSFPSISTSCRLLRSAASQACTRRPGKSCLSQKNGRSVQKVIHGLDPLPGWEKGHSGWRCPHQDQAVSGIKGKECPRIQEAWGRGERKKKRVCFSQHPLTNKKAYKAFTVSLCAHLKSFSFLTEM